MAQTTLWCWVLFALLLQSAAFLPQQRRASWPGTLCKSPFKRSATGESLTNGGAGGDEAWTSLRNVLRGTNVFFIGMMGSGKSTVGKEFAKNLGYRFLDTDEIAEFMIEMPIADFFAQGKETQFRDLEYQILMEMSQYTRIVLSTGGGIVERNENWGLLHHGIVVFLDLSPEDIFSRLSANPEQVAKRPLLRGSNPLEKLQELSEKRRDKYTQGDVRVRVPADASNEHVSLLAAQAILKFIEDNPPLWQEWKKKRDLMVAAKVTGQEILQSSGEDNILQ